MSDKAAQSIKVRMYRHGFGDCFLLSFYHNDDRVFAMLVDCGIKHNTRSDAVPIEAVIEDLKQTLGPGPNGQPRIDVLVATHEHWDHIAFFHPSHENGPVDFGAFDIGQVWLAWTENPKDNEAVAINSRLRKGAAALQVAVQRLHEVETDEAAQFRGFGFGDTVAGARSAFNVALNDVLGFYGVAARKETKTSESGIKYKPDRSVSVETESAMERIVSLGQAGGVKYLNPGTKVDGHGLPEGVDIFVLGPPRSSLINKSNPSSGRAHETYLGFDQSGLAGFIDRVLGLDSSGQASGEQVDGPFGSGVGMNAELAKADPYLKQTYFDEGEAYRRIDHSWLDVVGQFSLQLDGAINNTSLVLAIELKETGKVLLFPGDAQVGSWLSWHDHVWKVTRGDKTETVTASDLLSRTVLYKVSHHGSHNATVKDKGLELMTHPELVAMIPEREKSYNGILYEPLVDRLRQMCKGRVLISCDKNFPPEALRDDRPPELSPAEWKAFKDNLEVCDLYAEYTVR